MSSVVLLYVFNVYFNWIDYLIDYGNNDSNVFCSGNPNNNAPLPGNSGNQQSNIPPGNNNNNSNNPHHGTFGGSSSNNNEDNTLPFDTEYHREFIRNRMLNKLNDHRLSCAEEGTERGWTDTRLNERFTSQENEYICDKVMEYKQSHPNTTFHRNITGNYPDRKYRGLISTRFIEEVFGRPR